MPELPEVETIRGHLAPHVEGRTLETVEILDARWCRPLAPRGAARRASLGRRVEKLGRRGKYLVWELEDDVFLLMHLRMTGTLLLDPDPPSRRTCACGSGSATTSSCSTTRGASARASWRSARRRATRSSTRGSASSRSSALHGRAPVRAGRDLARAGEGVPARPEAGRRRRATSTPTRRCSARACTRCGRRTGSRARSARRIRDGVVESLLLGLESKGATIDDFRDPYGVSGSFQDQFLVHLREDEPCPNCGAPCASCAPRGAGPTCASAASRGRGSPRRA